MTDGNYTRWKFSNLALNLHVKICHLTERRGLSINNETYDTPRFFVSPGAVQTRGKPIGQSGVSYQVANMVGIENMFFSLTIWFVPLGVHKTKTLGLLTDLLVLDFALLSKQTWQA